MHSVRHNLAGILIFSSLCAAAMAAKPERRDQPADAPLLPVPRSEHTLGLAECLEIGAARQPAVRAAISSLRSTELGLQSLKNLNPIAGVLSPDLPYRVQQGEKGLIVGSADLQKALQENRYDVVRMYYSFVYARQQDATISEVIEQLEVYYEVAKGLLGEREANVDVFKLHLMDQAINDVRKLQAEARIGQSRALAALKEAMGVEQSYDFLPRDTELPLMGGTVTQDQVVAFALCRRPEIAMAAAGVDAFKLEVQAQSAMRARLRVQTLAIGSDLHSRLIPNAHRNGDYRPGGIDAEMPSLLVGSRSDRVARACEISTRQDALFDKTRELVALEAVNTYLTWQMATDRVRQAKNHYEKGREIARKAQEVAPTTRDQEMLIRFQALAGKAQAEYIAAVFEHILSLAALERVTSGGVCPEFVKASEASR